MHGNSIRYGTRSKRTQIPISGRLMMISIRLPTRMLATMPQTSSGRSEMMAVPGAMPWISIAPIISAITGFDGMPSVSSGMKEGCAADVRAARPQAGDDGGGGALVAAAIQVAQNLRQAEQSHGEWHEIDAVVELGHAESESGGGALRLRADQADEQAENDHADRLHHRAVGENDGGDQPEQHQREIFRRAEFHRECGEHRRKCRDEDGPHAAGEEGADGSDGERGAGAPLLRHLITVDTGHHRRRLAWQIDQDGRGGAAVLRAVIDAGEHDQGAERAQPERHRQQHGDGGDRADAGKNADQRSDQAAEQAEAQIDRGHRGAEAGGEVGKQVHQNAQTTNGCPSRWTNSSTHSAAMPIASAIVSLQRMSRLASDAVTATSTTASASPRRSIASANRTIAARINNCGTTWLRSITGPSMASARAVSKPPIATSAQLSTAGR